MLVDFGGVLTTSVMASFRAYSQARCGDPYRVERVLGGDEESRRLLVEHECGRIDGAAFEAGFAARLGAHGVPVDADGLAADLQAGLEPDEAMLALLGRLRADGVPVAIVSNSLGDDCYRGYDLDALADVSVISGRIGVRKPSRRPYAIACERLGVPPTSAVMIDDLQQNLDGAARLGIRGILHTDAATTERALADLMA
ncbi:UNVERIFIED_CONTAM: HAD family hydrolase [Mumia flava]